MLYKYGLTIPQGGLVPGVTAVREIAEAAEIAEQSGDDFTLANARLAQGLALSLGTAWNVRRVRAARRRAGSGRAAAFHHDRGAAADIQTAKEKARLGDLAGAIDAAGSVIDTLLSTGEMILHGPATTVLVESLLARGADGDLQAAQAAIDRLAAVPTDPGFVLHDCRCCAFVPCWHGPAATRAPTASSPISTERWLLN